MTDEKGLTHILVVDDNTVLRRMTVITLTGAGYRVTEATTGAEALRLARATQPQLVLLDVGLPDLDGREVCRRLKADAATAALFVALFSSTNISTLDQATGLEHGADGYIARPISNRELLARVQAMLRLQQAEAALRETNARLQAELAARAESEARLRIITENTYAWEFWIGPDEELRYCSPACERLTGHTAAEFIARPNLMREIVHPDDLSTWDAHECRVAVTGEPDETEFRIVRPDGRVRWLAHTCYPVRTADGQPWGRRGSSRDITARRELEQQQALANAALSQSEAQFRTLIENTGEGVGIVDSEERFIFANPTATEIFGVPADGLIGRSLHEFLSPEQLNIILTQTAQRRAGVRSTYELEICRPNGELRQILVTATPHLSATGQLQEVFGIFRDITDRKRSETALRNSEAQFRVLAETVASAIFIYQDEFICYTNPTAERITGYSAQELVGMRFWEIVHPLDRDMVRERGLARQRGEIVPARYRFRILTKAGELRWADFTASRIEYRGRPAGLGTAFDITELIQAQQAEQEQRIMAEALRDAAAALTSPLGFDAMLNRILEVVGRVMQHDAANILLIEDDVARVTAHRGYEDRADAAQLLAVRLPLTAATNLNAIRENGRPQAIADTRADPAWVDSPGTRWMRSHAAAPIRVRGTCIGFLSLDSATPGFFTQEKADRLQAFADQAGIALENAQLLQSMQAELAERQRVEEMLRTVLDTIPQRVFWKDRNSVLQGANRAYLQDHGLRDASALIGKPNAELFPRDIGERFQREDQQIIATDTPLIGYEESITMPGHTQRWLRTSKVPLHGPDGAVTGVLGTFDDITEEKLAQAKLQSTLAELERSNEELQRFAYVASHDLQEPLRMVASFVGLLKERYQGQLDSDADEFIAFAVDGAKRMQRLIDDLLEYSRIATRGQPLQPTDAEAALDDALWNLGLAIEDAGATVTHDPLPTVLADPTQLMQLLQNLIGNAFKFHGDKPPVVHVSARKTFEVSETSKVWEFSVRDNGIGIDPQYHDRIFGVFQRLHTRTEYPGTGIGLAICKKIVERHGGQMWVESQVGQGCTFYFTLPAAAQKM